LRRLAAFRFGAETAGRLSGGAGGHRGSGGSGRGGRMALVRCETGSEFLARVAPATAGPPDRRST